MAKLTDFKDEEALDLLADIMVPVAEIAQDEVIKKVFSGEDKESTVADVVRLVIKGHKSAVMDILAALDGVPREDYHCNILTLPMKIMEIVNDPYMRDFFMEQGQTDSQIASGSAMESTEEKGL